MCCFQYQDDADRFYRGLINRLGKFSLTITKEKTKIIPFGRFAEQYCRKDGKSKPATFDFLGFTHYCSRSYQGKFRVKRRTCRKKFRASLKRMKEWVRANRNLPAKILMDRLSVKLLGYYRYYGVTDNFWKLQEFFYHTKRALFKWLNRRSQRKSFNGEKFEKFLNKFPLPEPKIYINIMDVRLP